MEPGLLVARISTGLRAGQAEQQRRQLDQPSPADDRVDVAGRHRRQPEQRQHGQGRVGHRLILGAAAAE